MVRDQTARSVGAVSTVILAAGGFAVLAAGPTTPAWTGVGSQPLPTSQSPFTVIDGNSKDVEWSPDGRWIAYPKLDPDDGYYDVWLIRPNGSGKKCLTCAPTFPSKHNGNVTWHPSGEYLIFTAQNEDATGPELDSVATPGVGLNCNLWAMTADGGQAWQLTHLPTRLKSPKGVIHPQFSHDGTRLLWSEAIGEYSRDPGEEWGKWRLAIATLRWEDGAPLLDNATYLVPGPHPRFYESHGWSPDDEWILFSGNPESGPHPPNGLDLYLLAPDSGSVRRLTHTPSDWDEHAHFSPDGESILWMSGTELDVEFPSVRWPDWKEHVTTELWLMDSSGTNQRRLTYFNEPGHQHHRWLSTIIGETSRAVVSDSTWSPDGARVAFTLAYERSDGQGLGSRLVLMDAPATHGHLVYLPLASTSSTSEGVSARMVGGTRESCCSSRVTRAAP